jgi:hypothetical protein
MKLTNLGKAVVATVGSLALFALWIFLDVTFTKGALSFSAIGIIFLSLIVAVVKEVIDDREDFKRWERKKREAELVKILQDYEQGR